MRLPLFLLFIISCILALSCQQSLDPLPNRGNEDSTNAGLLVRTATFNSNNDSTVSNYEYNAAGELIKQWNNDNPAAGYIAYVRDNNGRIIRIENVPATGTGTISEVHYINANSGNIAYTISYKANNPAVHTDSIVLTYENNLPTSQTTYWRQADTLAAVYYQTLQYSAGGNIVQVQGFTFNADDSTAFNLGYNFEYDNNPNPYYTHDDVLHIDNWYHASPNNITNQVNHYDLSGSSNDYVVSEYQYDTLNRPVLMTWSGPFIDVNKMYFYYQ